MTSEYPYAEGDPREAPNTYAYVRYEGKVFLDAWRRSRWWALDELPPPAVAIRTASSDGGNDTAVHLERFWQKLTEIGNSAPAELDRLLHHFELTKRIFTRYDTSWRPETGSDFRDVSLYLRFAEVLDLAYANTGMLTYLNALLKCLDILIAVRADLPVTEGDRLARLIVRERDHVEYLVACAGENQ